MAADSQPYERGGRGHAPRLSGPGPFRRFMLASMASISYPGTQAEQLLLAPQELRTADPSFANELYNGHFGLAGRLAEVDAESPFEIAPPSEGWARELYGFGWLRHLRAAGSELSREQAKALVQDFITLKRSIHPPRLAAGDRRPQGDLVALQLRAGARHGRAAGLRELPQGPDLAAPLSLRQLPRRARRRAATGRADGADLCRAVHRRAAGGGRPLRAALLQGARPANPARRRPHLAQPRRPGRAVARPLAAQAMLRGTRPPAAEGADRRHRSHHADAALLPHRRRDACPLQRRRSHAHRCARHGACLRRRRGNAGPRGGKLGLCAARMRAHGVDLRHPPLARALAQHQCSCRLPLLRDELGQLSDDRQLRVPFARPRRLAPLRPLDGGALDADLRRVLLGGVHLARRERQPGRARTRR